MFDGDSGNKERKKGLQGRRENGMKGGGWVCWVEWNEGLSESGVG